MTKFKKSINNVPTNEILFLIVPILLFVILIGCSYVDISSSKEQTLLNCAIQNKNYLNLLTKNSITEEVSKKGEVESEVIRQIEDNFPTTSSTFMFVYQKDTPIFVRDATLTKSIQLLEANEQNKLKVKMKKSLSKNMDNLYDVILNNNEEFIVAYSYIETNGEPLLVGIGNKKDYIIKKYFINLLFTHIIFYLVIFVIISTAIITVLLYRKSEMYTEKEHWKTSFTMNRIKIDKLEAKIMEKSTYNEKRMNTGFMPKKMVEELMNQLTIDQKKKTVRIYLSIDNPTKQTYINLVACLEKKKLDNMISYMCKESVFAIVILNCEKNVAENYIRELLLFYEQYFNTVKTSVSYSMEYLDES